MKFFAQSLSNDEKFQQICDLLNRITAADKGDEFLTIETLRSQYQHPLFSLTDHLRVWTTEDGTFVATSELWINIDRVTPDGFLWFAIAPEYRFQGLEAQIIAWGEQVLQTVAQTHQIDMALRVVARNDQPELAAWFEEAGFTATRRFLRMARDLQQPIDAYTLPEGYRIVTGNHDPALWTDLYNESFVDHFEHAPMKVEEVEHFYTEADYRSELNTVLVAPDGTFAAFAWNSIAPEMVDGELKQSGWVNLLGVRRGFRKQGLGRAMLLHALHLLRSHSMTTAKLGVDSDSLTGATRLYDSAGFVTTFSRMMYSRPVMLAVEV